MCWVASKQRIVHTHLYSWVHMHRHTLLRSKYIINLKLVANVSSLILYPGRHHAILYSVSGSSLIQIFSSYSLIWTPLLLENI